MPRFLFKISSLCFLFALLIACGGGTAENSFPKKLPVDARAEKERKEIVTKAAELKNVGQTDRKHIEEFLESNSYYKTADGTANFVKEYTTYYLDEEKTTPIKTRYIYTTGSFDLFYWLPDGRVWLARDGYDFLIKGDQLIKTMRAGESAKATSVEEEKALEAAQKAYQEIAPISYTL